MKGELFLFISIEVLVANALLELFRRRGVREVSYEAVVRYGEAVARGVRSATSEEVILLMSRKYQVALAERWYDYFTVDFHKIDDAAFRLRDDAVIPMLDDMFRWTQDMALIEAMTAPGALSSLGIDVMGE